MFCLTLRNRDQREPTINDQYSALLRSQQRWFQVSITESSLRYVGYLQLLCAIFQTLLQLSCLVDKNEEIKTSCKNEIGLGIGFFGVTSGIFATLAFHTTRPGYRAHMVTWFWLALVTASASSVNCLSLARKIGNQDNGWSKNWMLMLWSIVYVILVMLSSLLILFKWSVGLPTGPMRPWHKTKRFRVFMKCVAGCQIAAAIVPLTVAVSCALQEKQSHQLTSDKECVQATSALNGSSNNDNDMIFAISVAVIATTGVAWVETLKPSLFWIWYYGTYGAVGVNFTLGLRVVSDLIYGGCAWQNACDGKENHIATLVGCVLYVVFGTMSQVILCFYWGSTGALCCTAKVPPDLYREEYENEGNTPVDTETNADHFVANPMDEHRIVVNQLNISERPPSYDRLPPPSYDEAVKTSSTVPLALDSEATAS